MRQVQIGVTSLFLQAIHRRLSTSDMTTAASDPNASDNLTHHVIEHEPKDSETDVALGTSISVTFDRDVRKVNINKLFEVRMVYLCVCVLVCVCAD